jgi:hypothetical protein
MREHVEAFQRVRANTSTSIGPFDPEFPNVPAGRYRLALAITQKPADAKPYIRLGSDLPTVDGWCVLGSIAIDSKRS